MSTVTYDVIIHMTIDIDADELIEECARDIIDSRVNTDIYGAYVCDVDISAA